MCRKFVLLIGIVMFLLMASTLSADIVFDDFSTPHDYLVDGVGGTLWDGFVGLGEYETADAINVDINEPNSLYLSSTGSSWENEPTPPARYRGPFLYKNVKSDNWIVVTRVSAYPEGVYWNLFGIMARASMDPDEAGEGEDSEQVGHFEVTHAANVQALNNGLQVADQSIGMLAPYLRLRQVTEVNELGDVNTLFYHEVSFDGKDWTVHPLSPRLRNDMTGLTLQLGMHHADYTEGVIGWGAYGETLILYRGEGQAWYQSPGYNDSDIDLKPALSWSPGPYVKSSQGHEIYLSDDLSKVEERNVSVKTVTDTNSYPITSSLNLDTVYYWCVDEVNDACAPYKWEGDVWNFSTNAGKASDPIPYSGQGGIPVGIQYLQWTQSNYAVTQDFYFGEDAETVANSVTPLVSDIANDVNVVDISVIGSIQPLLPVKEYYWRIESDCGALGTSKGDVWSFLTAYPYSICDDFEIDHDYFSGVEGTIWDGVMGVEEYCYYINTFDQNDGHLYIESSGAYWDWRTGVLLYKDVVGDFSARVEISDFQGLYTTNHSGAVGTNNAGIMGRVSDPDLAGPGEDWVSNDLFPGWAVGNIFRDCNNGSRSEHGIEGTGWNADRWLQIERRGNTFLFTHSPDGSTYTESPASPIERPDMEGFSLQVGPQHSTFGGDAYAEYDNFCLERNAIEKAYAPNPPGGGMLDPMVGILSWTTGDFAVLHNVYFSSDINDVNERKPAADRGTGNVVDEGGGRFSYDAGAYETIAIGQNYYWCIDEINDVCEWSGDVWRFEVQDYSPIDTFESYSDTGYSTGPAGTLKSVWVDGNFAYKLMPPKAGTSGSLIQLNTDNADGMPTETYPHYQPDDIAQTGGRSMKLYYDNDGYVTYLDALEYIYFCYSGGIPNPCHYTPVPDPYLSEVYAATDDDVPGVQPDSLDMKRDWSSYKVLKLSFYGDPNNGIEPMYIGLEDDDGTLVTLPYGGDSGDIVEPWWHDWYVALSEFTDKNAGLDLTEIVKIYIGIGDKDSPSSGNTGLVFFDDIQLYAMGQCIPDSVIGDFDDNCVIDNADLEIFTYSFPGEMPTLPTPIIELDADDLDKDPGEDVTSWYNTGSEHGTFTDVNTADANNPVFDEILGKKCVTFNGLSMLVWNKNAPATLTKDTNEPNDYTVIYEVYNTDIPDQEFLLSWARRFAAAGSEYERRHAAFGYGTNGTYGAICHWDPPGDMGFDLGVPLAERWHVIAATYDGTTNALIVDGLVHGLEDKDLIVEADQLVTVGSPYTRSNDVNDVNTNWMPGAFYPAYDVAYEGSIASIKVYAEAVAPGDLAIVTAGLAGLPRAEADVKPDAKIDFKDLAVMGNNWMQEPELLE